MVVDIKTITKTFFSGTGVWLSLIAAFAIGAFVYTYYAASKERIARDPKALTSQSYQILDPVISPRLGVETITIEGNGAE